MNRGFLLVDNREKQQREDQLAKWQLHGTMTRAWQRMTLLSEHH